MRCPTLKSRAQRVLELSLLTALFALSSRGATELLAEPEMPPSRSDKSLTANVRVEFFNPLGVAANVRQVKARFSDDVIPFADPRVQSDIFSTNCQDLGTPRWADTRTWIFDFSRDLPAGTRCTFKLKTDAKTFQGSRIEADSSYEFSTGGPIIRETLPYAGDTVTEDQVFLITLSGPVDRRSIVDHAYFSSTEIENRIPAKIASNDVREKIFALANGESKKPGEEVIALQPTQRLAAGSTVMLVWGQGIATESGERTTEDQTISFSVRVPFHAGLTCERTNSKAGCIPFRPIVATFSAPIARSLAQQAFLESKDGHRYTPQLAEEDANEATTARLEFKGLFPSRTELSLRLPAGLKDDSGRTLEASSDPSDDSLSVSTGDIPPLLKFAKQFGVIEWSKEAAIPVTVRDIEPELLLRSLSQDQIARFTEAKQESLPLRLMRVRSLAEVTRWISKLRYESDDRSVFTAAEFPSEGDPQLISDLTSAKIKRPLGGKSFEVMGIPIKKPGFYVLEAESPKLNAAYREPPDSEIEGPRPASFFVSSSALVTNLAVHLKLARERSLIWVTTLDSARPVSDARVTVSDCSGNTIWEGVTDQRGLAYPTGLPGVQRAGRTCPGVSGVFASATLGDDFSFTSSEWDRGIEPWRFGVPIQYSDSTLSAHSVLAESLVRRGKTVHLKHFIRERTGSGFEIPAKGELPSTVQIKHEGSEDMYELPISWRPNGTAESEWVVPSGAKLGTYSVSFPIASGEEQGRSISAGEFDVQDFRVPLMQARIAGPTEKLVKPSEVSFHIGVSYLAGGAAANIPITTRSTFKESFPNFGELYSGYNFLRGALKEGSSRSGSLYESWSGYEGDEGSEDSSNDGDAGKSPKIERQELSLDQNGTAQTLVKNLPLRDVPYDVATEFEYHDPSGEIQTASSAVTIWPAAVAVGIKPSAWTMQQGRLEFDVLTLDLSGTPLVNQPVQVDLLESKHYSHRTRLVGGFYGYDNVAVRTRFGQICAGVTDTHGILHCDVQTDKSGELLLEARTSDSAGRVAATNTSVWVANSERWWFEQSENDRIELLSEKKVYESGERAQLQVRSPFAKATALVTVEREGILDAFTTELSGELPIIEVPIKESYTPNVFVSVLLARGRVGDLQPTALLDLGKPAVKMGLAEIKVSRRPYQLTVSVQTDRESYHVRERAAAKLKVQSADGKPLPGDAEAVVAVVDEGLLELKDNTSWDLLESMLKRRATTVFTSSNQLEVIGKRHFGLKALPSGGGGGHQLTRELFDTLVLWKAQIPLKSDGSAEVSFPLNDSLSRFRVVAIASAGKDKFGTGNAKFTTTQDIMLLPGIAPIAREGDLTQAEATIRNTTNSPVALSVTLKAEQVSDSGAVSPFQIEAPAKTITLAGNASEQLHWKVQIPVGITSLRYALSAVPAGTNAGSPTADALKVSQQILAAVPVRVYQATLQQVNESYQLPVSPPEDAIMGRGGIQVALRGSLLDGTDALRRYMKAYPYSCLEQRTSRAISLNDATLWNALLKDLPSYIDSNGLLKFFPSLKMGSQPLTIYFMSIAGAAKFDVPDPYRTTLLDSLSEIASGKNLKEVSPGAGDVTQLRIGALAALSYWRALDTNVVSGLSADLKRLPTFAVVAWWRALQHTEEFSDRARLLNAAKSELLARLNYQGTTLSLSTELMDSAWWAMSSVDDSAIQLVLAALEFNTWENDIPKLLRGTLERQQHGHWDLTTANAWGVLMLRAFSARYEKSPVSGSTSAELRASIGETNALGTVDWSAKKSNTLPDPLFAPFFPGSQTLQISHRGTGAPWAVVQSLAAIPLKGPLSSGYRIDRTLEPVEQHEKGKWTVGDIIRVKLKIDAQADRNWVVVDDPVPASASILGTTKRSQSLANLDQPRNLKINDEYWWFSGPVYTERSFSNYRAYFDYTPKGAFEIEYTIRLNAPGEFQLPTTRVEAMYSPEMFGEFPNAPLKVEERQN